MWCGETGNVFGWIEMGIAGLTRRGRDFLGALKRSINKQRNLTDSKWSRSFWKKVKNVGKILTFKEAVEDG
jgi:hypothetical protein